MSRHIVRLMKSPCLAALFAISLTGCGPASEAPPASAACTNAIAAAARSNSSALFDGFVSCGHDGHQADANYLILLGQIRAMPDMTVLKPIDEENMQAVAALYGKIYYQFGGLGFDEIYRTPASVAALEEQIRATDVRLYEGYNPGWIYKPSVKPELYENVLVNARENRLWQMRNVALKLQNDQYWETYTALKAIPQPLIEGSPEKAEHARLSAKLDEIGKTIPELPPPPDTTDYAALVAQEPEVAARQVAVGFNGPREQDATLIRSKEELQQSWLAAALGGSKLDEVIAKTDFTKEVLLVYSFGERTNASGQVTIGELGYREAFKGYTIDVRLGVVPASCGVSPAASYPFVVGIADAVPDARIAGQGSSNYPVSCGAVVSAPPTTP